MYIPTYSRTCQFCSTTVSVQDRERYLDELMDGHWMTLLCREARDEYYGKKEREMKRRGWWSWR